MTDEQLANIVETLGRLDARSELMEKALLGNGQPGLSQRVDSLESSRDRMWGAGAVFTFLAGLMEWFFHRK